MGANLVQLNVNPCKMCMPMGAVSAFYGIQKCITILHGSQGCSTYIRRHMATHYNEPVDIASSSLTEQGTVFGGADNLIKGLENLIELYDPKVIGVATSCLAETIGEDIPAIIKDFYQKHPEISVKIIPVASAGYSGTQYEGFFRALFAIVSNVEMVAEENNKVNIITGMISPADTRYLKSLLKKLSIDYILLPDLSENLDGVHTDDYNRLPGGGTSLEEIAFMGGAKMTIELSSFIKQESSPAQFLYDNYGVPFVRMNLPVGLKDTDAFIAELVKLGGVVPKELTLERGRYIDAMIDSHKYNAEGRATIFGEPDFVSSTVRLCCENGIVPVVAATGSVCHTLKAMIEPQIQQAANALFVDQFTILEDADFDMIEKYTVENGANLMIGNSDGHRVADKLNLELVRCAFPVHDRIGGQRQQMLGYEGSLQLLDRITNVLLANKGRRFRTEQYEKYYKEKKAVEPVDEKENKNSSKDELLNRIAEKTATHPCYNCGAGKYARIHLPIAPKCNVQCNYCVRKYDCPNESRPGVTTEILTPEEAFQKYAIVKGKMDNLKVVGIAGPGDSLANFEETKKTLTLIKEYDPDVTFCLSTNGLMLPYYAEELIQLGVSHVTVTINAVDPKIGAKIYKYVDFMGTHYTGETGAAILMANQLSGLKYLTSHGVVCKVNTVMLSGINEDHIEDIVKKVKELGCYITNIMQLIPVQGSAFESMPQVSNKKIMEMRKQCEGTIKQMYHCKQCRADAIGTLDNDLSIEYRGCTGCDEEKSQEKSKHKFAVATKSGILVDQHFGHADEFYIYQSDGEDVTFCEKRKVSKYCTDQNCDDEESKMDSILNAVQDCDGVLALRIGFAPSQKLEAKGIKIFMTYDRIEAAVKAAASQS
jgi:nitrogenase molybdenum-iron protein alpha/beta subunit/MoaA/NifB/PqqE/SkfB family radical SAM enzyme